jgi:hypothetical protein
MVDSYDIYRNIPSYRERLAEEKKINVYYMPGTGREGKIMYSYAVCSALLHEQFVACVKLGEIPDYAVVVAAGDGEPDQAVKDRMKLYYGFDHDAAMAPDEG